jgi:hypothetical protein
MTDFSITGFEPSEFYIKERRHTEFQFGYRFPIQARTTEK